jgi:hypothetical protein
MKYVLEGSWSGYSGNQSRVCHRSLISAKEKAERVSKLGAISFTDGTWLYLSVRRKLPHEKIGLYGNYSELIDECLAYGVSSVQELHEKKSIR